MRFSVIVTIAALSALAGSVSAAPNPDSAPMSVTVPATATPIVADGDKVVCKTIAVTGTRFPEQQCRTKQAWADQVQAARDYVNKATTGPCTGGSCGAH